MRRSRLALRITALIGTVLLGTGLAVAIVRSHPARTAPSVAPTAPKAGRATEPPALPRDLADTGLYSDPAQLLVDPANVAFTPQYPLWTDGATKRRWIRLPSGARIDGSDIDAWVFPLGTRLWKEFSFEGRRVETRFIERRADGQWVFASYAWSADQRRALLAPEAGVQTAAAVAANVNHRIPGRRDCGACHSSARSPVLGFSALQLSPDRDPGALHKELPPSGAIDLRTLVARDLIEVAKKHERPRIQARTPVERSALGYLHANCGHCHHADGPLAGLDLSFAYALGRPGPEPTLRTVLGRPSRFGLPGDPNDDAVRLRPGVPDRSVLLARMQTRDPNQQMPPLGTALADDAAVELITFWINEQRQETSR